MIPRARPVLDASGLAAVHGLSVRTARHRGIWLQAGHPAPVQAKAGRWPPLWDAQQVQSFVRGDPVPELPQQPHPEDLLNSREAAAYVGQKPASWDSNEHLGYAPAADQVVHGVKHWRRATLDAFRAGDRPRAAGLRGRRARNAGTGRTVAQDAVLNAQQQAQAAGEPDLTLAELARRAGVSKPTAHRYRLK